jgi:hypothetical protein
LDVARKGLHEVPDHVESDRDGECFQTTEHIGNLSDGRLDDGCVVSVLRCIETLRESSQLTMPCTTAMVESSECILNALTAYGCNNPVT